MKSLEILDLSRNKIKAFPASPGSLINIRVLHLGRNKIVALPTYFPSFRELNLLKIEHNQLKWPPSEVLQVTANSNDPLVAARWVSSIQGWIKDHLARYGAPMIFEQDGNEDLRTEYERYNGLGITKENGRSPVHDRTPSNDSVISQYSYFSHSDAPDSPRDEKTLNRIVNKLLSPENLDDYSSSERSVDGHAVLNPLHGRNASLTYTKKQNGSGLQGKKSLPELRTMQLRPNERSKVRGRPPMPNLNSSTDNLSSSLLSVQLQSNFSKESSSDTGHTIRPPRSMFRDEDMASAENGSRQAQPPPMDGERNSYFRRMSTLPASTISKAVPKALLVTIDAARGILFALSQIYSALRHYIVFAINDRLSGVLNKVLDPASQYLARLITALDRFDALCRSGTPPPAACRGVLEGCRDNIYVFSKVIGVLQIQLKVLAGSDDVRYTRTLLLMLYGSMAELSNSWMAIAPQVEEVKNLVRDVHVTPTQANASGSGGSTPLGQAILPRATQTIPEDEETTSTPRQTQPPPRPRIIPTSGRRQAGSFSATDLRRGRDMPIVGKDRESPVGPLVGVVQPLQIKPPSSKTKAMRSVLKQPPGGGSPRSGHGHHSPSLSNSSHGHEGYNGAIPNAALSSDKDKFVDASTLSAMEESTDLALRVWKQVEDLFEAHMNGEGGVIGRDYLMRARELTMALRSNIRAVLDGADGEVYGAALWEGANTFSKVNDNLIAVALTITDDINLTGRSKCIDVRQENMHRAQDPTRPIPSCRSSKARQFNPRIRYVPRLFILCIRPTSSLTRAIFLYFSLRLNTGLLLACSPVHFHQLCLEQFRFF